MGICKLCGKNHCIECNGKPKKCEECNSKWKQLGNISSVISERKGGDSVRGKEV